MSCWGGPGLLKILSVPHFTDNMVRKAVSIVILVRRCLYIKTPSLKLTSALYRLIFNMTGKFIFKAMSDSNYQVGPVIWFPSRNNESPVPALGCSWYCQSMLLSTPMSVSIYIIAWLDASSLKSNNRPSFRGFAEVMLVILNENNIILFFYALDTCSCRSYFTV